MGTEPGSFTDQAVTRAVIEVSAVELNQSDCALPTPPEAQTTVGDFILSNAATSMLKKSYLYAECSGRGNGKCSVAYCVMMGEKAD